MSSESDFAYAPKYNTHFIVRNTTGSSVNSPYQKTLFIFNYPINYGDTRDLLAIPGIEEADIRASLLKGVLRHKLLNGDIALVSSNIDLLQFSDKQRSFLHGFGFTEGVVIGIDELGDASWGPENDTIDFIKSLAGSPPYLLVEEVLLIGAKNNSNRTFNTPNKFLNGLYFGNQFHIHVKHDGKDLYEGYDYSISESGGPGTGFDTIYITAFAPKPRSLLVATYAVKS